MFKVTYQLLIKRNENNQYPQLFKPVSHTDDSGVDVFTPSGITIPAKSQVKIKLGIHCSVRKETSITFPTGEEMSNIRPAGFYLLPRSSISKTPLRLSNSIGLIDAGYRGEIMAPVDNISEEDYCIEPGDRLFQLVNADLEPFKIVREVENLDETERGEGGFGSTGK